MNPEEENTNKEDTPSKEDEIMERLVKYSQGCSFVMIAIITIIVFVLLFLFS